MKKKVGRPSATGKRGKRYKQKLDREQRKGERKKGARHKHRWEGGKKKRGFRPLLNKKKKKGRRKKKGKKNDPIRPEGKV